MNINGLLDLSTISNTYGVRYYNTNNGNIFNTIYNDKQNL